MAKSLEKFTAMDIGPIRIQDSLQFLNYSLDKLVSNLKDKGLKDTKSLKDTFPTVYTYFKKEWGHQDEEEVFQLLTKKGVYPYECIDSFERFKYTKLPEKEKYYSNLSKKDIINEEYKFAKKVWSKCN